MDNNLEKIHRLELMIALDLKRICEKHDIKYFILAGTLLGSVRHKGFIPWDDDMDIGMLREDYNKFLDVCKKELDEKYFLQTWDTDSEYPFSYAKIRLKNTHFIEAFSEKSKMHNGIFIDIFPFDAVPDNAFAQKIQGIKYFVCKRLLWIKKGLGENIKANKKKYLKYNLFLFVSRFFKYESIKNYFYKTQLKYNHFTTEKIVTDGSNRYKKESIKRNWADNLVLTAFEGEEFYSFRDKEEYLTYFYGDYNKLPPENERNTHMLLNIDFGPYENKITNPLKTEENHG